MKMHKRIGGLRDVRIFDSSVCGVRWATFNHPDRAYITDDETKVTCKTCIRIMGKKKK